MLDILIPSYKGWKYLPLSILALSLGDCKNYRIIVSIEVFDKNYKKLLKIIDKLNINIKVITRKERIGLAENRKILLRESSGEYILWLDDDVLISAETINELLRYKQLIGDKYSIITGVSSNFSKYPKVACGLGLTLMRRKDLLNDISLNHEFGFDTGEDWLWTSRICYKLHLPILLVKSSIFHLGEKRQSKRYTGCNLNDRVFKMYLGKQFYNKNKEELEYSHPVHNYSSY